jgi:hypothetical protein
MEQRESNGKPIMVGNPNEPVSVGGVTILTKQMDDDIDYLHNVIETVKRASELKPGAIGVLHKYRLIGIVDDLRVDEENIPQRLIAVLRFFNHDCMLAAKNAGKVSCEIKNKELLWVEFVP